MHRALLRPFANRAFYWVEEVIISDGSVYVEGFHRYPTEFRVDPYYWNELSSNIGAVPDHVRVVEPILIDYRTELPLNPPSYLGERQRPSTEQGKAFDKIYPGRRYTDEETLIKAEWMWETGSHFLFQRVPGPGDQEDLLERIEKLERNLWENYNRHGYGCNQMRYALEMWKNSIVRNSKKCVGSIANVNFFQMVNTAAKLAKT